MGLILRAAMGALLLLALVALSGCRPDGVEICHVTGQSPTGIRLVTVFSDSALLAHLGHGDEVFGTGLDASCQGGVRFSIDEDIELSVATIGGLDGGPPRPVGVVVGPDGKPDEFVLGEVQFRASDDADLQAFLERYGASIVRRLGPDHERRRRAGADSGRGERLEPGEDRPVPLAAQRPARRGRGGRPPGGLHLPVGCDGALRVTDSDGNTDVDTILIIVGQIC